MPGEANRCRWALKLGQPREFEGVVRSEASARRRTQGTRPALGHEQRRDTAHQWSATVASMAAALELSMATENVVGAETHTLVRWQIMTVHDDTIRAALTARLRRPSLPCRASRRESGHAERSELQDMCLTSGTQLL